jgi:hypothetical protein
MLGWGQDDYFPKTVMPNEVKNGYIVDQGDKKA